MRFTVAGTVWDFRPIPFSFQINGNQNFCKDNFFNLLTKKIPIKYLFNKTMICCITYEKQFQELFPAFATRFFWIRRRLLPPPNPKKSSDMPLNLG